MLSNKPPKGTSDWLPAEFSVRKYIFDIWRQACIEFGYLEYLTPLFESADIYTAKSGEDIGGKELMVFTDKAGRQLAIRPEMTPSVTRMVSKIYPQSAKPLRLFSIANFVRNEKPQRGRNREFWQLNYDVFGTDSLSADVEVINLADTIMQKFSAPKDSYTIKINNRKLIESFLTEELNVDAENKKYVVRMMDKFAKVEKEVFNTSLLEIGLKDTQIRDISDFLTTSATQFPERFPKLTESIGWKEITEVINQLSQYGVSDRVTFSPEVMRGFDYYDGIVFEVFDNHPDNNRAIFGGGRYNGLAGIFGSNNFPAVGAAPGDETLKLFLESWDLLKSIGSSVNKEKYYLPLISSSNEVKTALIQLTKRLRSEGSSVTVGLEEQSVGKAMNFANENSYKYVIFLGDNEIESGTFQIKDMDSGAQIEYKL